MPLLVANRSLLDAFRRGSPAALREVYDAYVSEVERLLRCGFFIEAKNVSVPGLSRPSDHCEAVQEVFTRAFSEPARLRYDGLRPYRFYLLRIAKNLLIDAARKRNVPLLDLGAVDLDAEHLLPHDANELDADPGWLAASAATRVFIDALDGRDRDFVRLRFEQGETQREVGEKLRLTRRQVRHLEDKICARLRAHLKERGLDAE